MMITKLKTKDSLREKLFKTTLDAEMVISRTKEKSMVESCKIILQTAQLEVSKKQQILPTVGNPSTSVEIVTVNNPSFEKIM